MAWLFLGVLYSSAYAATGWLLRGQPEVLSWFRAAALLAPPLTGATVIFRRRHTWRGCQWLFWSTIALGLTMSAMGLTGWAAEEILLGHGTWLAWPAVFALFGGVAPLFALLAQPHRGPREPLAATTAIDIAGLAVVTGFLYSFFVTAPSATLADSGLRAAAGAGRRRHGGGDVRRLEYAVARHLPPAHARRVRQPRHADAQQRRSLAGHVPHRVRLRLHVDSAVRVLPVGGDAGAGSEQSRSATRPSRKS